MKSLGEILDRGLYHTALEGTFRTRNAVEQRETRSVAPRADQARRAAPGDRSGALRASAGGTGVSDAAPEARARSATAQGGSNCQFSAHSGLPALGVPAGFTDDGLPIGIELLGAAFKEQELLSLGYAIEQTLKLRRQPFSMPALVAGKRPSARKATAAFSGTALTFSYDETLSRLQYTLSIDHEGGRWRGRGVDSCSARARSRVPRAINCLDQASRRRGA